jgi:putative ABC transport system permease protein
MESLLNDVRYGARMLLKKPAFTAIAVLALALGIGANSAIFSVVNSVLLQPLPYEEPDRLVILWEKVPQMDTSVAYLNFVDWREQNQVFESISAFRRDSFNLTGSGEPERLQGRMVSASFFGTLGVRPAHGRDFTADEDRPGADRTVILSHELWQRRFGVEEDILGRQLTLNEQAYTVIGVTPQDFDFGARVDMFVPIGLWADNYKQRGEHPGLYVIARMKPGVTEEQARADMNAVMGRLEELYPDTNKERRIHLEPYYENVVGEIRPSLLVLLGAVGFVLLIACANVANLLLARAALRQKEIAIRTALGAGRSRLIRQLLTESVMLALLGGVAGLILAYWGIDILVSFRPDNLPRIDEITIDGRVVAFTFGVSLLTGILFGLAPAIHASKTDLNETLKESGGRGNAGTGLHRFRNGLVIVEVALALVLLIGAGLLIKSFARLQEIRPGFEPRSLLTMMLSLPSKKYTGRKSSDFFNQLQEKVESVPGVERAAFSNGLPFAGAIENSFQVVGRPKSEQEMGYMGVMYLTSPEYIETLKIPLLRGRFFTKQDTASSPGVTVIDEELARSVFPNEDPLGKHIAMGHGLKNFEIIGIVGSVKHYGFEGRVPVQAQFYIPFDQVPEQFMAGLAGRMSLTVRTSSSDPLSLANSIRDQVFAMDKDQPVFGVQTMELLLERSLATRRFSMLLLTAFALVALVLSAVGIYGVMSYSVNQRTREIGIRMAMGARGTDVLKLVVGHGMMLTGAGLAAGLASAFGLTRLMASLLFGVTATDPLTYAGISALLALVALLACYIPARRATKVDPMIALRYE